MSWFVSLVEWRTILIMSKDILSVLTGICYHILPVKTFLNLFYSFFLITNSVDVGYFALYKHYFRVNPPLLLLLNYLQFLRSRNTMGGYKLIELIRICMNICVIKPYDNTRVFGGDFGKPVNILYIDHWLQMIGFHFPRDITRYVPKRAIMTSFCNYMWSQIRTYVMTS